jgi:PEP-CTERM motif
MNSIRIWTTRVVAAAACVAATLPASAQAQTGWAECQQAVQGEAWGTAPCLSMPHFTLVRTDNPYTYDTRQPFLIERLDESSISLVANVGYSLPVGPFYGAGHPGGYLFVSRPVGPIIGGLANEGFDFAAHNLSADVTNQSWRYSYGEALTTETQSEIQTVNFKVLDAPLESFASLTAYQESPDRAGKIPFTIVGRDQYSQGPNGTAAYDSGSTSAISVLRLTASVQGVPEPSSWALMGLGLFGVGAAAGRQRRQ